MKPWILPVLLGALILGLSSSLVAGSSVQLVGAGLIGNPVPGKTITSPSDFGFAVTANGGTFVCSMAGPLTGGFKGLKVMTVEGPVAKGSLRVRGGTATFNVQISAMPPQGRGWSGGSPRKGKWPIDERSTLKGQ